MDALDGLKALEQIVETIGEQLDDLYQRQDIPQIERVTLRTLEWTLAKLADDLHTMRYEERDLRLSVAAARRELAELIKKASSIGIQQLTPRQVEISDSTGTDGEGQS